MDNRKRQRLDVARSGASRIITVNNTTTTTISNENCIQQQQQQVSASLLSNANTLFLDNGTDLSTLPANVFLTICDDDGITDDDSQEYYAIDSETFAAHIKQEHQQHNDLGTQTLPPLQQIRLIQTTQQPQQLSTSQMRALLTTTTTTSAAVNSTNNTISASALHPPTASELLPASMQLPSGCEIYLVKEFIDTDENGENGTVSVDLSDIEILETTKSLKVESTTSTLTATASDLPIQIQSTTSNTHNMQCNVDSEHNPNASSNTTTTTAANTCSNAALNAANNAKRQNIMIDAYKKRDDKRRATHNEVERRRRDKINSWIFKLKEMLPTEMPNTNNNNSNNSSNSSSSTSNNINISAQQPSMTASTTPTSNNTSAPSTTTTQSQQPTISSSPNISQHNSNRTPPSDSKSQILIKACEYIKVMQEEITSLRECLTENNELRLSNQRLLNELQKLKNEQQLNKSNLNQINSNRNTANVTLNMNGIKNSQLKLNNNNNNNNCKINDNNNSNNFNVTISNLNSFDNTLMNTPLQQQQQQPKHMSPTAITKTKNILINNLNKNKKYAANKNAIIINSSATLATPVTVSLANSCLTPATIKAKRELIIRDYVD